MKPDSPATVYSESTPLEGRSILVTAPKTPAVTLFNARLRQWGGRVEHIPLIEIRTLSFTPPSADAFDWLFFTSKNGVHSFFQETSSSTFTHLPIATIGPATAMALEAYKLHAAFIAPHFNGINAAEAFTKAYAGETLRILWPCGDRADRAFAQALSTRATAHVTPLNVYETRLRETETLSASERLAFQELSAPELLVFTSPSAVEAYTRLNRVKTAPHQPDIACLGPKTAEALRTARLPLTIQAEQSTLDGLADAIRRHFIQMNP